MSQAEQAYTTKTDLADRVLIRTMAEAVVVSLGPKKGERFLRAWAEAMTAETDAKKIFPIRGQIEGLNAARDEAEAWLRRNLSYLVGKVSHAR